MCSNSFHNIVMTLRESCFKCNSFSCLPGITSSITRLLKTPSFLCRLFHRQADFVIHWPLAIQVQFCSMLCLNKWGVECKYYKFLSTLFFYLFSLIEMILRSWGWKITFYAFLLKQTQGLHRGKKLPEFFVWDSNEVQRKTIPDFKLIFPNKCI